eukprot:9190118-Alexandrium_andersonii.AAC.1
MGRKAGCLPRGALLALRLRRAQRGAFACVVPRGAPGYQVGGLRFGHGRPRGRRRAGRLWA